MRIKKDRKDNLYIIASIVETILQLDEKIEQNYPKYDKDADQWRELYSFMFS